MKKRTLSHFAFRGYLAVCGLFATISTASACGPDLSQWERIPEPILRDTIANEPYEVASDSHVFVAENGDIRMIYTGDDSGEASIKLGAARGWQTWTPFRTLLGPSPQPELKSKETPFYLLGPNGEHQIYFIAYEDGDTYRSQIFLATSDKLEGPYTIRREPVVPLGELGGTRVRVITSPSVVEHGDSLLMTFVAWNGFHDVTRVWSMGAESMDNGRTWTNFREVDTPITMEGQLTRAPDGTYLAVSTREYQAGEAIFLACADHPFGPYKELERPILVPAGGQWEKDEITAPQIFFDPETDEPMLYYTGADHRKGWWIMMALPKE